jgi:hypothetical protein
MEMPVFKTKFIVCIDCGCDFLFNSGEQRFFWSKGLAEPRRCSECRLKRKLTIDRGQVVRHDR